MNKQLLTVDELATILRVKKSWIYAQTRQTDSDSIPVIRVKKYLRFQLDEVMDWLKRQQNNRNQT